MSLVSKRLSKVFKKAIEIPFDDTSKIILMSDCHRGDGTWSDTFSKNQNAFLTALNYYFKRDYTYIEIGDGDELWANKNPTDIIKEHIDCFWLMARFYKLNRLYFIYGNHDMCKKNNHFVKLKYYHYYDKDLKKDIPLFDNIKIHEGIILKHRQKGYKIFLVHGHQGDFLNDQIWKITRFLFNHVWKPLELFGVKNPTSAAKNNYLKNKIEKDMIEWSAKEKQIMVAGHTHRSVLPNSEETPYFNTGCCVYPSSITGIEIEKGNITLIKWSIKSNQDGILYIGRDVLGGPIPLVNYLNKKRKF